MRDLLRRATLTALAIGLLAFAGHTQTWCSNCPVVETTTVLAQGPTVTVNLLWSYPGGAILPTTGQTVLRGADGSAPVQLAALSASDRTYTDATAEPGHDYTYVLRATNRWGSTDSAPALLNTRPPTAPALAVSVP